MSNYSDNLAQFEIYLRSDWKRWVFLQFKQTLLMGKSTLRIAALYKKDMYKKGKHLLNFWKKIDSNDSPYYDKNTNIIVMDAKCREFIDYITNDLQKRWFLTIDWDNSVLSQQYYTLYASATNI